MACPHMRREIFQLAVHRDAVLKAQLLPELHADLIAALADLQRDDFARHVGAGGFAPSADAERGYFWQSVNSYSRVLFSILPLRKHRGFFALSA